MTATATEERKTRKSKAAPEHGSVTIRVARQALSDALARVMPAVAKKSTTMPVLAAVLLEANHGELAITGTNLDQRVTVSLPCEVDGDGVVSVCLPGQLFADAVQSLPPGSVAIAVSPGASPRAVITGGRARFSLAGHPLDEYPKPQKLRGASKLFSGDPTPLLDAIGAVLHAAEREEETRPVLSSVCLTSSKKGLHAVATNGKRLALVKVELEEGEFPEEREIVIPRGTVAVLRRILAGVDVADVHAGEDGFLSFGAPHLLLGVRVVGDRYPNFWAVIPQDSTRQLVVDSALFKIALERLVLITEANMHSRIDLAMDASRVGEELALRDAKSSDHEVSDVIPATYTGPETSTSSEGSAPSFTISTNPKHLLDALAFLDGESITLEMSTATRAIVLRRTEDTARERIALVMPHNRPAGD